LFAEIERGSSGMLDPEYWSPGSRGGITSPHLPEKKRTVRDCHLWFEYPPRNPLEPAQILRGSINNCRMQWSSTQGSSDTSRFIQEKENPIPLSFAMGYHRLAKVGQNQLETNQPAPTGEVEMEL